MVWKETLNLSWHLNVQWAIFLCIHVISFLLSVSESQGHKGPETISKYQLPPAHLPRSDLHALQYKHAELRTRSRREFVKKLRRYSLYRSHQKLYWSTLVESRMVSTRFAIFPIHQFPASSPYLSKPLSFKILSNTTQRNAFVNASINHFACCFIFENNLISGYRITNKMICYVNMIIAAVNCFIMTEFDSTLTITENWQKKCI